MWKKKKKTKFELISKDLKLDICTKKKNVETKIKKQIINIVGITTTAHF